MALIERTGIPEVDSVNDEVREKCDFFNQVIGRRIKRTPEDETFDLVLAEIIQNNPCYTASHYGGKEIVFHFGEGVTFSLKRDRKGDIEAQLRKLTEDGQCSGVGINNPREIRLLKNETSGSIRISLEWTLPGKGRRTPQHLIIDTPSGNCTFHFFQRDIVWASLKI